MGKKGTVKKLHSGRPEERRRRPNQDEMEDFNQMGMRNWRKRSQDKRLWIVVLRVIHGL